MNNTITQLFLKELESEARTTRNCLVNIKDGLADYKPHEKSMAMGGLCLMAADIPRWISTMIDEKDINFATYKQWAPSSAKDYATHLDETMVGARKALEGLSDDELNRPFNLKSGDQLLATQPLGEAISSTINHWVHHRGQLTVYMRLNDLPVPSIYGPSADDKVF
jgi:uncharacterized damage-inducible protein DinB